MTSRRSQSAAPSPSTRRRGFTLVELLVAVGIVVILLSIFVPYGMSLRESSRRIRCAGNLRQIRDALFAYARDNGNVYPRVVFDPTNPGYTAFTGADASDPFAVAAVVVPASAPTQPASTMPTTAVAATHPAIPSRPDVVEPNDVTASLWLLVRSGFVKDTAAFICPSSGDWKDRLEDANGRPAKADQRGNFRKASNLSYSYASPFSAVPEYRLDDTRKAGFVLIADKNPGVGDGSDVTAPQHDAPPLELARASTRNHGHAGQNVVYSDGNISFQWTPYCGVGRGPILDGKGNTKRWSPGDNIYTTLSKVPLTNPPEAKYGNGFIGTNIGPSWDSDTYLVPTDQDGSR